MEVNEFATSSIAAYATSTRAIGTFYADSIYGRHHPDGFAGLAVLGCSLLVSVAMEE